MTRYFNDELYHFGINGMKLGKRNGPPYPLSYDAHTAKQKKIQKELLTESQRIKIKIAIIVLILAIVLKAKDSN